MKWVSKGHEFDDIGTTLKEMNTVFFYGAVPVAQELIEILTWIELACKGHLNIYTIDRDPVKQRQGFVGGDVISPDCFFNMEKKNYFVVICTSSGTENEIREILKGRLEKTIPIFSYTSFLYKYLSVYLVYKYDKVFFSSENMLPSTVCNLSCRDCLNFTPYIKKHHIASIDELKNNVDLFFRAVDFIYLFQITGGEPFLYQNLQELIEYIDQKYRYKIFRIELVTNGTIEPSDELCEYLKKRKIHIILDNYCDTIPEKQAIFLKIRDKFRHYSVPFRENCAQQWIRMYIPEYECDKLSVNNLIEKFEACDTPWCSLRQGKLSACNYAMYAESAGICQASDEEYFDLNKYDERRKKELIEFRLRYSIKGYTEFCRMCNGWMTQNLNWCSPAIQMEKENFK